MIEVLCTQLPTSFCEIDALAAILLRFCRDHAAQLRLAYDSDEVCDLLHHAGEQIQQWLEDELDEDWLDGHDLAALRAALRRVAEQAAALPMPGARAAVVAARAAAEALDRSHGRRFAGVFRGRGITYLKAGDPIPVCHPPLKSLFERELSTDPLHLGPLLHELVWLRLMPELSRGHQVCLSFECEDLLADLTPRTRLGVAIPSDVQGHLRFEHTSRPRPRFFGVRPRYAAKQRDIILRLLDRAAAAGVRILVLPELCLDQKSLEAVKAWFSRPGHGISLLVCGSVHVIRDGNHRNVSTTLLPGGREIEHFKFNPFHLPLPGDDGALVDHREDIVTTPSLIRIDMCVDWSFTTLICKDFLEPEVDRILEALGVRLVLIPSCSLKTSTFEHLAASVAARNQAVVIVGNLADPGPQDPASVIFARPTHRNSVLCIRRSDAATPCLHFLDLAGGHTQDDCDIVDRLVAT